jgi:hypothetical protein
MVLEIWRSRECQQRHEGLPLGQDLLAHSRSQAPLGTGSRWHPCPTLVVSRRHRAHARVIDASSDSASQEEDAQTAGVPDGLVGALALHPKVKIGLWYRGPRGMDNRVGGQVGRDGTKVEEEAAVAGAVEDGLVGYRRGMRPEATMISSSSSVGDRRAFAGVLMTLSGSWYHKGRRVPRDLPRDEDIRS